MSQPAGGIPPPRYQVSPGNEAKVGDRILSHANGFVCSQR